MADQKKSYAAADDELTDEPCVKRVKTATDLQRHKLEKLMKDAEKTVFIPERPKEKKMLKPPEFMRNNWGSSAGAGSGDFHVYRGVRRREYARQKFLDQKQSKEQADEQYHKKVEENIKLAEERSSKKREKRLKKKQKNKKNKKPAPAKEESESDEEEAAEEEAAEPTDQTVKA